MEFLDPKIDEYVCNHTEEEPELLKELSRETWAKVLQPRMLSGHLQGRVLSMLSKMIKPEVILEIGTYTGYSAICLAEGLSETGVLHTIDINEELKDMTEKYLKKAHLDKIVKTHVGDALDIIPEIQGGFDLVFIDADKENYSNYFDMVIDRVNTGGYIIADNVLWSGKVIEEIDPKDEETQALVNYSNKIKEDNRVEALLLPVRDGLMISRKK